VPDRVPIKITTAGSPRCVTVRLNFEYVVPIDERLYIGAFLDDQSMLLGPAFVSGFQGASAGSNVGSSSFEWILDNVPDGVHLISFQFKSGNGGEVSVNSRSVIVLY
jgi:hypothetical protein